MTSRSLELENDRMEVLRSVLAPLILKTTLRDGNDLTRGKPFIDSTVVLPSAVPVKSQL
jgi:hypothetical protein